MSHSWYNDDNYPTLSSPHSSGGQPNIKIGTSPIINNPGAITVCSEFTLPTISGHNLSGNQAYYDDSQANNGNLITGKITSSTIVWIYDYNGSCSDEESFEITVREIDNTTSSTENSISSNHNGGSYQWVNCDDSFSIIPDEIEQFYTPLTDGYYAVIINDGICVDTSECVSVRSLGIQNNLNSAISIYPNPSNNIVNIKTPNYTGNINVNIYDLTGRLVNSVNQRIINIRPFQKGIYNLRIEYEDVKEVFRIIKN